MQDGRDPFGHKGSGIWKNDLNSDPGADGSHHRYAHIRLWPLGIRHKKDGETALTLLFRFDENGLIESVRAEARGRTVAGAVIPTPWEVQWSNYEQRDGMCIPTAGEVAWLLPEGPKPYFRGRVTNVRYEFAQ